jgi:hypothetical protein
LNFWGALVPDASGTLTIASPGAQPGFFHDINVYEILGSARAAASGWVNDGRSVSIPPYGLGFYAACGSYQSSDWGGATFLNKIGSSNNGESAGVALFVNATGAAVTPNVTATSWITGGCVAIDPRY